ncbi:MAG: hypothetical protein JNK26_04340 [Candidatus Doudnabacteria bacterium]|nr:hypothetical protein [Candidatus Doudnabacteria bacterium]
MRSDLLIFTFWIPRGIIARALFPLKDKYKILYVSGDCGLRTLESQVVKLKPRYILGLGYYRKGMKYIRSEQTFQNSYGKSVISPEGKAEYASTWKLSHELIKDAFNAGNSRCNQFAYTVADVIEKNNLSGTKFAYLHVAPDYPHDSLRIAITDVLESAS